MSAHGINLYHVEASAASVQRLLVSFWRYLANENYDLSSEGFYSTSTLVSSPSCRPSRLYAYVYMPTRPSSEPDWFSRAFYFVRDAHGNNSTCSRRYLSKNDNVNPECGKILSVRYLAGIKFGDNNNYLPN